MLVVLPILNLIFFLLVFYMQEQEIKYNSKFKERYYTYVKMYLEQIDKNIKLKEENQNLRLQLQDHHE